MIYIIVLSSISISFSTAFSIMVLSYSTNNY